MSGRKGKYLDWLTPDGLLLVAAWARDGLIDEQIAKNIGIAVSTFCEWKNRFPEFSEALKRNKAIVDTEVENALLKRALGYEYEEVKTIVEMGKDGKARPARVEKIKKHVLPDVTAGIYWTKNRQREKWRDLHKFEHTGEDGGPIQTANIDVTKMSLEEIERELVKLEQINQRRKSSKADS